MRSENFTVQKSLHNLNCSKNHFVCKFIRVLFVGAGCRGAQLTVGKSTKASFCSRARARQEFESAASAQLGASTSRSKLNSRASERRRTSLHAAHRGSSLSASGPSTGSILVARCAPHGQVRLSGSTHNAQRAAASSRAQICTIAARCFFVLAASRRFVCNLSLRTKAGGSPWRSAREHSANKPCAASKNLADAGWLASHGCRPTVAGYTNCVIADGKPATWRRSLALASISPPSPLI